jgi:predicted MFS family arabinose efflux permease
VASSLKGNREFSLLWTGQAVSSLGSQISTVAFPLLVLAETGSPAKAGVAGFARNLPVALLALPGGALADRVDRKRVMQVCNAVRAIAMAVVAILLAVGHAPYGLLLCAAAIDGSGFVISFVTERGALRRLVTPEQLPQAVARNESRTFGAALAGPPLGGLLYGIAGVVPFLADAVSYVVSTITLLLIHTPLQDGRAEGSAGGVRDGLRWIWARPFARDTMLLFAGSNPVFLGMALLVVVLARDHGASAGLIGVMLGIASAGGLLGALVAPTLQRRLPPRVALVGETWVLTLVLALMLLTREALLLGVLFAAAEVITPVTNSIVVSWRVANAPDALQGRVQAGSTVISSGFGWLGPLVVGYLLGHAGATATIWALTSWMFVLALGASWAPAFRGELIHS